MAKNGISPALANKILSDVGPNAAFWIHNGSVIRNIHELIPALASMSDEAYQHHVNETKNDFANWVKDILNDKALSKELMTAYSRKKTMEVIKKRITYLEKVLDEAKEEEHSPRPVLSKKIFPFITQEEKYKEKKGKLLEKERLEENGGFLELTKVPKEHEDVPEEELSGHEQDKQESATNELEPSMYDPEETVEKIEADQSTHLEQIKHDILEETYRKIAFEKLMNRILFLIIGLISGILIGIYFVK